MISRQKAELETERRRRQTAEEALMRAEEATSGDHEQRRSRVKDDRPRFIRKQPWWLPVLIAALLGAGICWLTTSLIGWLGNDNGTIMNEQTAQAEQAPEEQVPQEEPQPVEETPEEPEEQPVEEPEETPVSEDTPGSQNGNDETATQEMIQKVSGMAYLHRREYPAGLLSGTAERLWSCAHGVLESAEGSGCADGNGGANAGKRCG